MQNESKLEQKIMWKRDEIRVKHQAGIRKCRQRIAGPEASPRWGFLRKLGVRVARTRKLGTTSRGQD